MYLLGGPLALQEICPACHPPQKPETVTIGKPKAWKSRSVKLSSKFGFDITGIVIVIVIVIDVSSSSSNSSITFKFEVCFWVLLPGGGLQFTVRDFQALGFPMVTVSGF